jgi:hypothetical protein
MPSIQFLETRNASRLDGTYIEDLKGGQAWKGIKPKGMERTPADVTECCHALRFCLISKLDCTRVCPCSPFNCCVAPNSIASRLGASQLFTPFSIAQLNLCDPGCLSLAQGLTKGNARHTLEIIYLWKNGIGVDGIKAIAKPIGACPRLKELNVYRNRLGDAGALLLCKQLSLGACAAGLQTLWLSDNNICTFPEAILQIPGLVRLYLAQNRITIVPKELGLLEKLKLVDMDHNPTEGLPDNVYYRSRRYFRMRAALTTFSILPRFLSGAILCLSQHLRAASSRRGMNRLPGPRWDLLRPIFRNQMGLDLPDEDDSPRDPREVARTLSATTAKSAV